MLCSPPFVPFRLLRRMRRSLLPAGTLQVEAALCSAEFVEGIIRKAFAADPRLIEKVRAAYSGK